MWRAAFLVALVGCVQSQSHVCADGRVCPAEQVCDDVHALCVFPDQLTSCADHDAGAQCAIAEVGAGGECVDNVCIAQACGDNLVTGAEVCDGPTTQPSTGTCVDLEFDYGALACSNACGDDSTNCGRLGWQFVGVPGQGTIRGFALDGDQMWAAGANGIYHRDASGAWTSLGYVTAMPVNGEGIWASGGHVFVVGTFLGQTSEGYVLHYDGSAWTEQQVNVGGLHGVWGRSATEVYAAGDDGIYKFDGTAWTMFQVVPSLSNFRAISGNANLLAATTTNGDVFEIRATNRQSIHVTGTGALTAIVVLGDTVYVGGDGGFAAVGENSTYNAYQRALPARITAMTARGTDEVYVATEANPISNLFILDGKAWAAMASPLQDQPVNAIYATPTEVIAARRAGTVMVYQGAGWIDERPVAATPSLGLWMTDDYGVSAPAQNGCELLERTGSSSWQTTSIADLACCSPRFGLAAFGIDRTNVFVGGAYGLMLHKTDVTWTCQAIANNKWIWSVWAASPTDVWGVGADRDNLVPNLVHTTDGTTWIDRTSDVPFATTLKGVWGASSHDVFAVGANGVIAHYDGTAWTRMDSTTTNGLNAVWGSAGTDVFAAGENGTILHYDGTAWSAMPLPIGRSIATNGAYVSIHGTSSHDVYVIGQRLLLHYDGMHWSPIRRPDELELSSVFALANRIAVVTEAGVGSELMGFNH